MARGYYPRIASLVAQEQCVVVLCEVVLVKFGGTGALSWCSEYGGIAALMGRGALPASSARLRTSWRSVLPRPRPFPQLPPVFHPLPESV